MRRSPAVLVVGLGNELRGDDGVGLEVVRCLTAQVDGSAIDLHELQGEPIGLLDEWAGRGTVILVDSMRSGATPGTIRRIDAIKEPLPGPTRTYSSTHAVGLRDTIEVARTLGVLPTRLTVYAVEGRSFEAGSPLSDEVSAAVPQVAALVRDESMR